MAKRLLQKYEFVPAEDKIILEGNIDRKRLLLITNMEDNETSIISRTVH